MYYRWGAKAFCARGNFSLKRNRKNNKKILVRPTFLRYLLLFFLFILININFSILLLNENRLVTTEDFVLLVKPAFAQNSDMNFLDEEAGISVYTNINQKLDLDNVKLTFKTIEKETTTFIIGSISLPNLPETDDVHCFIHEDGWIVVYYLKDEPVSKIIDWNYYSNGKLTKTKLQIGLGELINILGVITTYVNYYHFQYQYANKFMIIVDSQEGGGTDSFNLKIPSEFVLYERSWSHRAGEEIKYGLLTENQLSPDIFHTVEAYVFPSPYYTDESHLKVDGESISEILYEIISEVGIALVYRES